jgi:His-Xaa-Ser system radical SAM maturase HxsB
MRASECQFALDLKTEKLTNGYIAVSPFGFSSFLTDEEHDQLVHQRLQPELFSRLEKENLILTDRNKELVTQIHAQKQARIFQGTSLHIVIPTLRCNHRCIYCHASAETDKAEGVDMDEQTAEKVVDFIFQSPAKAIGIEFQGGEPLLNFPIVERTIKYAEKANKKHKKNLRFAIVTNLTEMTDEKLDFLMTHNVGICTSLDGPKEVHDSNRKSLGGGSSYDEVVPWIRKIVKRDPDRLNALTVVTRKSLAGPGKIMDQLASLGLKRIWFKHANFLGYAVDTWKKVGYTAEEYVQFYERCIDHIIRKGLPIRDVLTTMMLRKIMLHEEPNYLDLQSPCGAAIGQLAYQYDGSVYSCDEGRMVGDDMFRLGTVEESYKDIMSSPETKSLICSSVNDIHFCENCVYKPYCGLCPVCNYKTHGNLIPILPLDMRCRILKGMFTYLFEKLHSDKKAKALFSKWVQAPKKERI